MNKKNKLNKKNNSKIKKKIKENKLIQRIKDLIKDKKKRWLFFGSILIFLLIMIYLITNFAVLINFLLGNDTLVNLSPSANGFNLKNGEFSKVTFSISVSPNIFCTSSCDYNFLDISHDKIIDSGNFSKRTSIPLKKDYDLYAPLKGEGTEFYYFEITCNTKSSGLCKSEEKEIKRSSLVGVSYSLNDYQENLRNETINKINELIIKYDKLISNEEVLKNIKNNLSNYIYLKEISIKDYDYLKKDLSLQLNKISEYNYEESEIEKLKLKIDEEINLTNSSIEYLLNKTNDFNNLLFNINQTRLSLKDLKELTNLTINDSIKINNLILNYNGLINRVSEKFYLEEEINILNDIKNLTNLKLDLNSIKKENYVLLNINNLSIKPLEFNVSFNLSSNLKLEDKVPICCYKNICEPCLNESLKDDYSKYPVLFLHGHSFNEKISAQKSLGDFQEMHFKLSSEPEFIDGGQITLGTETKNIFQGLQKHLVFSGSYYFDIYQENGSTQILQTKSNDINTYAIRLNDLINTIKRNTGKNKVIIVAHSMGGLVSRRYIQIYGEESVAQLIMIGTPNNGIDGTILKGCPVFGASTHCRDLDKDSLLINKLKYGEIPSIKTSVIIGQGCKTDGEESDGVVKISSAYLEFANNYYVNGTCSGLSFFHNEILSPTKYPEVYELTKELILNK